MFSWVLEDLVRSLISYHNVTTCVCIRFYFREVAFDVFYFSLAFLPLTLLLLQQLFYDFWTKQLSLRSRLQILRLSTYSTVNGCSGSNRFNDRSTRDEEFVISSIRITLFNILWITCSVIAIDTLKLKMKAFASNEKSLLLLKNYIRTFSTSEWII